MRGEAARLDLLDPVELEERLEDLDKLRRVIAAIDRELSVIEQWVRVLEFRLGYAKKEEQ